MKLEATPTECTLCGTKAKKLKPDIAASECGEVKIKVWLCKDCFKLSRPKAG